MRELTVHLRQTLFGLACLTLAVVSAPAQTKPSSAPEQDDVVRVNTDLVQTDVMVFDKKGRFVDGLQADQFALKVDNKPQTVSFFERVTSGKASAQQSKPVSGNEEPANKSTSVVRGRIVIFFVDDLHLAPSSLDRTRKALTEFVDHGMTENDEVAITSSSGQIGFLQQFSNDRRALLSAVARLNYKANPKLDMDNPPMSEY